MRSPRLVLSFACFATMTFFAATSCSSVAKPSAASAPPVALPAVAASAPVGPATNGLAATVNGRAITRSEVDDVIKIQLRQAEAMITDPAKRREVIAKLRADSLESLIVRELILDDYKKLSGGQPIRPQYVDEDIKEFIKTTYNGDTAKFYADLKQYGMTLKKFRETREKMLIVSMMRSHATKDTGLSTPEKKEKFMKEHGAMFRVDGKIKLRSITISKIGDAVTSSPADQKKLIGEIRRRVKKGSDFASEAKTYSKDYHSDAGGDWGWIDKSSMASGGQLADVAFSLGKGELSEIIEDSDNYYLFFVEDKEPGKMKPKAEIDAEIERMVQMEEKKKANDQWVERLKSKANIKRF